MSGFNPNPDFKYTRLVFETCWMNASPSAEVFYLPGYRASYTMDAVDNLIRQARATFSVVDQNRIVSMTFVSVTEWEMTGEDAGALGARVLG